MIQVDINAAVRKDTGKGVARSLRRAGQTPGVVYGAGDEPTALSLDTKELTQALFHIHRRNAVVNLDIDDNGKSVKKNVLIREVQVHPVKEHVVHADFSVVALDKEQVFNVPVNYTGKAKGVDLGGELSVHFPTVPMKGKPLDIPDELVVDVSALNIGDSLAISIIEVPAGASLQVDADKTCVEVIVATQKAFPEEEEEEAAAEEEAPAEETSEA